MRSDKIVSTVISVTSGFKASLYSQKHDSAKSTAIIASSSCGVALLLDSEKALEIKGSGVK